MYTTSKILMVRPVNFAFNPETAYSNAFQDSETQKINVQDQALIEFDNFVSVLRRNEIEVYVINDVPFPQTPDSIFPNNWISTHEDGSVFLYPMEAINRRQEKRPDIIEELASRFEITSIEDLSYFEQDQKFLEGTGSMVLDRKNKLAYACLSSRTNKDAIEIFCSLSGYIPILFEARDSHEKLIYHTNVMMCLADSFVVICLEVISNADQISRLRLLFSDAGKEVIEISYNQMRRFAGNMLQLCNKNGINIIVMSRQAYLSLSPDQLNRLQKYGEVVSSPLDTIERSGGGSARCMIAEIFLKDIS